MTTNPGLPYTYEHIFYQLPVCEQINNFLEKLLFFDKEQKDNMAFPSLERTLSRVISMWNHRCFVRHKALHVQ